MYDLLENSTLDGIWYWDLDAPEEFDAVISKVIRRAELIDREPEGPNVTFERIMLVDDDPIVVLLAQKLIERANITVPVSNYLNGKEFIDALKENEPSSPDAKNLVLLDLNMPVMNGWEVLEYLSREGYEESFVINILTSSISNQDRARSEKYLFVKGYLEKPMNAEMVDELIRRYPSLKA